MFDEGSGSSLKDLFSSLTAKKAILWIVVIGFLVYANSLFNGFVADDHSQITRSRTIQSLNNFSAFFLGGTFYSGEEQVLTGVYYKPLLNISYALNYAIGNGSPFPFHFFQMFLHIVNACILFIIFKHFFKLPLAFTLALLFLVHPINSEAAFYIADTQDVLFFFFGIISLWILKNHNSRKALIVASICLLFSLLSKETGLLFIFLALVQIFLFTKKSFLPLLGYISVVFFIYLMLRINAVGIFTKSFAPIAMLDLHGRFINMPEIFFFYLKTFFFPFNLAVSYQQIYTHITFNHFFLTLFVDFVFLSALGFFAVMLYKRYSHKYFVNYIFFLFWFIIGISLHLQIIPLDATVAERWFYFPIVGLLGMGGVVLEAFQLERMGKSIIVIAVIILILLSIRTFIRSFDWRNDFILVTHDITISKDDFVLENILASELIKRGQWEEAKIHAEKSIKIYPSILNYNNLGIIYLSTGDYKKAEESYLKGLEYGGFYLAYENLASLYMIYGNQEDNITFLKSAIRKYPQNARLLTPLAVLEYNNNHIEEAKKTVTEAYGYSRDPQVINIYNKIMNDLPININFRIR